jgi:serine/threonine-protein kinase
MVDEQGRVKVLDFGLAKAFGGDGEGAPPDLAHSPTLTAQGTRMGALLGTAAYMSPEQAKGRPVDRRADVWAFGVVLWEMLTGERLFEGETVSDVLAAVLRADVDVARLEPLAPPGICRLIRRCLARDPRQRLQDIGDARLEIAEALEGGERRALSPPLAERSRASTVAIAGAALAGALLAVAALLGWRAMHRPMPATESALHLPLKPLPAGFTMATTVSHSGIAISRDGRRLAMTAFGPSGEAGLVVRDLGRLQSRLLEGTADAHSPFFSPDGQWVGFFSGDQLLRIPFDGGPVERLALTSRDDRGADWSVGGTIYFAPTTEGGLFRLPPSAGEATPLTKLDPARGERTHRWPHVLPGGEHVLFTSDTVQTPQSYDDARIEVVTVSTGARRVLVERASAAAYSPSGHLLFARGGSLYAVRFDARRLEVSGEPELVVQRVTTRLTTGAAQFAVSASGSLVYLPGEAGHVPRQPAWINPDGTTGTAEIPPGSYSQLVLSPDGRRVALGVIGDRVNDVWVGDVSGGPLNRLTFTGGSAPVWTPDGRRIAFQRSTMATSAPQDGTEVFWKAADGSDEERALWKSEAPVAPTSFSPDGKLLLGYRRETPTDPAAAAGRRATGQAASRAVMAGSTDLWAVPVDGGPPRRLFTAPGSQFGAELSPDGQWLAYLSDESGRFEVYVRPFTGAGGRWQVTTSGGVEPHWSPDGRALYYRHLFDLMRLEVQTTPSFTAGPAQRVATGLPTVTYARSYAVAPDGRVLFLQELNRDRVEQPVLVLGFARELESRKP